MRPDTDHPWLGRLAPNLILKTDSATTDVATLLATGRWLLLDLTEDRTVRASVAGWAGRVDVVTAACPDHPELAAILLRPDGHTAWLRTTDQDHTAGLHQALRHWHPVTPHTRN
jgi:hypothetical protein